MNKSRLRLYVVFMIAGWVLWAAESEFIQKPKEKRFYPSCQQSIELKADIIALTNQVQRSLNQANKWCIDRQEAAIADIMGYVEGDKECFLQKATKHERSDAYSRDLLVKQKLKAITALLADIIDRTST